MMILYGAATVHGGALVTVAGAVFIAILMVALNHTLQFGESLAESGRAHAALAVWAPIAVFGLFSLWFFSASLSWPGDNPITRATAGMSGLLQRVLRRVRRTPQ